MLKSSVQATKVSKVVVCGYQGCGKTAILEQFIYGSHAVGTDMHSTIEDIYLAHVDTDRGSKEKVIFYDTAGLDLKNFEVSRAHIAHTDGAVLVFSVNNIDSFRLMDLMKKDLEKHKEKKEIAIVALANKADLVQERQVDTISAQSWAQREKIKLYEVSVADPRSLIEPFIYLTSKMNPPPSKSTFAPLVRKGKGIPLEL